MSKMSKKKSVMQRVDIQVALFVTILVVLSSLIVFFFAYTQSYKQMISSLATRVNSIAEYVDKRIPASVFIEITDEADMLTQAYQEGQLLLSEIREISCAQYLYTATKNKDGKLIYHIDGLSMDNNDFRKPGDLIEPDFQKDLATALSGTVVMPGVIMNTEWGDVFVAYYPLHSNGEKGAVIGALGIEFPANREYKAFQQIRYMTPFVILLTCILAFFTSKVLFRRISNPHFKDLANTDSLTGLKNRNAYDLDIENFIQSKKIKSYALLLADLNSLKIVNDQLGHKMGDDYIKILANALKAQENEHHISYRIGGDEFATFFFNPTEKEVTDFIANIKQHLEQSKAIIPFCSVSVGYAISDKLDHTTWATTQIDADIELYRDKKSFYENNNVYDSRK